jgi:predicted DNA-binding transcriptional regulator YafY
MSFRAAPRPGSEPQARLSFTADELAAIAGALAAGGTRLGLSKAALSAARKVVAAEPEAVELAADREPDALARIIPLRSATVAAPRPEVDDEIRELVERGVRDRRVLRLVYTDSRGRPSDREVEPAGVIAAGGHWYLVGWCRSRREGRGFRLDRIVAGKLTDLPVPDRDLADVLGPLGAPQD